MITIIYLIQLYYEEYVWFVDFVNPDININKVLDEGIDELCNNHELDRTEFDFFLYHVDEDELKICTFRGNVRPDALIYTNIYFDEDTPIHHHPLLEELFESHQESLEEIFGNLNLTT